MGPSLVMRPSGMAFGPCHIDRLPGAARITAPVALHFRHVGRGAPLLIFPAT